MLAELKKLRELYEKDINIIGYIKEQSQLKENSLDIIKVSYDLQAGSYVEKAKKNTAWEEEFSQAYADVLNSLGEAETILDAGVGEATTLFSVNSRLNNKPKQTYGFDLSYSRIQFGQQYLKEKGLDGVNLFTGDLFNTAFLDSSIDIVYTSHALEPNRGREKEALSELYRVARKYLVLFEPDYSMADEETRAFMDKHGYIKDLHPAALELGYKVKDYRLLLAEDKVSVNKNNTSVLIIEKDQDDLPEKPVSPFACPITRMPLELIRKNYFSRDGLLLYPVVDGIPCLLPENAIIATQYLDKENS